MPTLTGQEIAQAWIGHFWAADHSLRWIAAEVEHFLWLTPNTLLAGRIDALGENHKGPFFGEWKSANPRERNSWKQVWRMNPQSLTYGVLAADWWAARGQVCSQFTVRKAFKTAPPTFDHEWYSYSEPELEHWRGQLIKIAEEIRAGGPGPWETNWAGCFMYGPNYPCPHFETGCSKMKWGIDPFAEKRVPHLEIERRLNEALEVQGDGTLAVMRNGVMTRLIPKDLVVLDATRIAVWFRCREKFRREYVENVGTPVTEALQLGIDMHEALGEYYQTLVDDREG